MYKSSHKDMFTDFRERRRERERNTDVRKKHPSVASYMYPDQGSNPQPAKPPGQGSMILFLNYV